MMLIVVSNSNFTKHYIFIFFFTSNDSSELMKSYKINLNTKLKIFNYINNLNNLL